ncbi:hypothetical protein AB0O07_16310 [Streptomyces sp. NPDC093085]|uniref:hypothetical protein n=1 Tax=Streptomyces sp. NPDC093085 TaxID=3155068 RepID=UPI0034486427
MPGYYEVMHIKLAELTAAADGWKDMAGQFKKLEDLYEEEVQNVASGSGSGNTWTGESASAATSNFAMTRGQFAAARKEALGMESLLRDAYATFTDLKGKVKSAVADAVKAGMKVSDQGVASYDYSKVDAATANSVRHDPGLADIEHSYTRNIMAAVKVVSEFDQDVKVALLNASGADNPALFGFNPRPVGDVQAVEALALTEKIDAGKASEKELKRYREVLKENGGDKHFSEAYLNALGAEGTVRLADQMNLAAHERGASAGEKKLYESISTGLATTVASGTKDPDSYVYKSFMKDLRDVGASEVGDRPHLTSGYQALVTLLPNGEGYGKQFLNDVGDDLIKAEQATPRAWSRFYDPSRPNLVSDPLDSLLQVMSNEPDAATYFLDPEAEGNKNGHLKYLLADREWPETLVMTPGGGITDIGGSDRAEGLGAAIEAAATGKEPGTEPGEPGPHTEGQARVMHNAIRILDDDMGGDEFPENLENLRRPMARALTDYVADTHIILNGQESAYGGVRGADNINGSGDKAHIAVGQASLVRVMRGIADDAPSFSLLYETERAYGADQLAQAPAYHGDTMHGNSADWDHRAREIGVATGALNGIGADVYKDKEEDRVEWAEDTAEYSSIVANGLIGEIPILSTAGGALIDSFKYDWTKDVVSAAEDQGKQDSSKNFGAGADGTNSLMDKWRDQNENSAPSAFRSAKDSAGEGYIAGREAARAHLRS